MAKKPYEDLTNIANRIEQKYNVEWKGIKADGKSEDLTEIANRLEAKLKEPQTEVVEPTREEYTSQPDSTGQLLPTTSEAGSIIMKGPDGKDYFVKSELQAQYTSPKAPPNFTSRKYQSPIAEYFAKTTKPPIEGLKPEEPKKIEGFKLPEELKQYYEKKAIQTGLPLQEETPYFDTEGNIRREKTYSPYERQTKRYDEYLKRELPKLEKLKAEKEKENLELEKLHNELENKKNNLKTPQDIAEYNQKVELFNSKLEKSQQIGEYERLVRDFESLYQAVDRGLQNRKQNLAKIKELSMRQQKGELSPVETQQLIDLQRQENIPVEGADISKIGNMFRSFYNVFPHQVGDFIKALGILKQTDPLSYKAAIQMQEFGDAIKSKLSLAVNPYYQNDFISSTLPQAFGSSAMFYGAGVAGRLAKLPTYMLPLLTASLPQATQGYEEAKERGASYDTAMKSFLINLGLGATEIIPVANLFKKLDKGSGGLLYKVLNKKLGEIATVGLEQGLEEVIQEVGSQFLQNVTAKDILKYDIERDLADGLLQGGAAGLITGFFMGSVGAKIDQMLKSKDVSKEDKEQLEKFKARIDEMVRESMSPEGRWAKTYYKAGELPPRLKLPYKSVVKATEEQKPVPGNEATPQLFKGAKQPPDEIITQQTQPTTEITRENKEQEIQRIRQQKQWAKEDNYTYAETTRVVKNAQRKNNLIDTAPLENAYSTIKTPELKEKYRNLLSEVKSYNDKLIKKNQFTLENLSRKKYGTTNLNSLNEQQQRDLLNEYNEMKKQGITEFKQLKTITPTIGGVISNAIQKQSPNEVLQPKPKEAGTTRGEYRGVEQSIEGIEPSGTSQTQEITETETKEFIERPSEEKTKPEITEKNIIDDIERRRQKELSNKVRFIPVRKFNPDKENEVLLGEDLLLAERRIEQSIQSGIKQNMSTEGILKKLNTKYAFLGPELSTLKEYIDDRKAGKTSQPFWEFRKDTYKHINDKYDKELAGATKSPQIQPAEESVVDDEMAGLVQDLLGKPIAEEETKTTQPETTEFETAEQGIGRERTEDIEKKSAPKGYYYDALGNLHKVKKSRTDEEAIEKAVEENNRLVREALGISEEQKEKENKLLKEGKDKLDNLISSYQQVSDKYYIKERDARDGKEKIYDKEVKGRKVIIKNFEDVDLFAYKNDKGYWVITDGITGFGATPTYAKSKKLAEVIEATTEYFNNQIGYTKYYDQLKNVIEKYGITPRYKLKEGGQSETETKTKKPSEITETNEAAIKRMLSEGKTPEQIATALNISKEKVNQLIGDIKQPTKVEETKTKKEEPKDTSIIDDEMVGLINDLLAEEKPETDKGEEGEGTAPEDKKSFQLKPGEKISPEKQLKAIQLIEKFIGKEVYAFENIVSSIEKAFGEEITERLIPALKAGYTAYLSNATEDETSKMDAFDYVKKYKYTVSKENKLTDENKPTAEGEPTKAEQNQEEIKNIFISRPFINRIREEIRAGNALTKTQLEKIAKEYGINDPLHAKEQAELAIVTEARKIINETKDEKDAFDKLLQIYENQPNLTHRTNTSVENQQYSTPVPISYVAGLYVADKVGNGEVLEPSAGNGMLTIAFDKGQVYVNEIDPVRSANLRQTGYEDINNVDAANNDNIFNRKFDGIITNPPFGSIKEKIYDGYKFKKLDHVMVANALKQMKDNGRAAIIIGGHNIYDSKGRLKEDRTFFNWLYHHYNVDAVLNINADLYKKQGAQFPIRLILVNGRKAVPEGAAPLYDAQKDAVVNNFEELYNRIKEIRDEAILQPGNNAEPGVSGTSDVRSPRGEGVQRPEGTQTISKKSDSETNERKPTKSEGIGETNIRDAGTGKSISGQPSGVSRPDIRKPPLPTGVQPEGGIGHDPEQTGGGKDIQRGFDTGPITTITGADLDSKKPNIQYRPQSKGVLLDTVIPRNMSYETFKQLQHLAKEVGGDIDQYVADKLGYESKEELFSYLGAEQIDALAFAITAVEKGEGMIIGDMAGVGKGRIAASMIRYAVLNGYKPIFFTEKPRLFSDLYRDLQDTGNQDLIPFIINDTSNANITDQEGEIVYSVITGAEKKKYLDSFNIGNAHFMVSTYSQVQNESSVRKREFISRMADKNILILDEAHNASGEGNTGNFFRHIVSNAKGVVFLSATFAKRPNNMPVYAKKLAIKEANLSEDKLIKAIENGGVALQEVLSTDLVEARQMIRREKSYEGIKVDYKVLEEKKQEHIETVDKITDIIRDIINFQRDYVKPIVSAMDDEAKIEGETIAIQTGTNLAGVDNTPFASKIFNVTEQLLFALKAKDTALEAINQIKQGKKPVIAIKNTMESFLDYMDAEVGDIIESTDFSAVLERGLKSVLKIRKTNAMGAVSPDEISIDSLGNAGRAEYEKILNKIKLVSTGISISPIDEMIYILNKEGYKVGEVTGRNIRLQKRDDGKAVVVTRKDKDINKIFREFNNWDNPGVPRGEEGYKDIVMLVNASGSTGGSAHASPKFKDQRPRVMITTQIELNINTEVQKRGRINRTGQVVLPEYITLSSAVPAEQRLLMLARKKLKSLDANVSSDQKQTGETFPVEDFLNKYGDQIVIEYLKENREFNDMILDPFKINEMSDTQLEKFNTETKAAHRVTGRVAILPAQLQEDFYKEITQRYADYIEYLNSIEENDLEVRALKLDAMTISSRIFVAGKGGHSPFGRDSILETAEINVLKKPLRMEKINEILEKYLGGKGKLQKKKEIVDEHKAFWKEWTKAHLDKRAETIANNLNISKEDFYKYKDYEISESIFYQKYPHLVGHEIKIENEYVKYQKLRENLEAQYNYVAENIFGRYEIGGIYKIPLVRDSIMPTYSNGVFLGWTIHHKRKNPFAPNAITMKFAVADSRQVIQLQGSNRDWLNDISNASYSLSKWQEDDILSEWDSTIPDVMRELKPIITGNILQAIQEVKGQLITYTTKDGKIKRGILVKDDKGALDKDIRVPIKRARNFIKSINLGDYIETTGGEVRLIRYSVSSWRIEVAASKAKGGAFYLSPDITKIVDRGRFDKWGNRMRAYFPHNNIDKMIDLLQDEFGLSVRLSEEQLKQVSDENLQLKRGRVYKDDAGNDIPSHFAKVHEFKLKHNSPYLKNSKIIISEPKTLYWTREHIKSYGYSDAWIDSQLEKLKEGDFGYERGKEKFAVEIQEATTPNPDGKGATIYVSSRATPSAYTEGIIHALYKGLENENPELLRKIQRWEQILKEEAKEYGIDIPDGEEIFAQAMVFTHLGYADENPEVAELFEIPKDILDEFTAILNDGEISADVLRGESQRRTIRLLSGEAETALEKFRGKRHGKYLERDIIPSKTPAELPQNFNPEEIFDKLMEDGGIKTKNDLLQSLNDKIKKLMSEELLDAMRLIGTEDEWKIDPRVKDKLENLLEYAVAKQELEAAEGKFVEGRKIPIDILTFDVEVITKTDPNLYKIQGYRILLSSDTEYYYKGKIVFPSTDYKLGLLIGNVPKLTEIWTNKEEQYKKQGEYVLSKEIESKTKQTPYWVAIIKGNTVSAETFAKDYGYAEASANNKTELRLRKATKEEVESIGEKWSKEWGEPEIRKSPTEIAGEEEILSKGRKLYEGLKKEKGEKTDIYPEWRKKIIKEFGQISDARIRDIWNKVKKGEAFQIKSPRQKKLSDFLSPSEILLNKKGVYPTTIAIKEAKEILGDRFETEYQDFRKKNPPAKVLSKEFEEGLVLENFARKVVAAKKMGIDDYNIDLIQEITNRKKASQPQKINKNIEERLFGKKTIKEISRERGEDIDIGSANLVDFGVGLGNAVSATVDKIEEFAKTHKLKKELGIDDDSKLQKIYRELLTAPQWFFDKEPQLRALWDIIDRHFIRNVNEEVAILKEDKWGSAKTWRKLKDTEKEEFLSALKDYEYNLYELLRDERRVELLSWSDYADEYNLTPKVREFLFNTYKPLVETALDMVKDVDRYKIINETERNPYLQTYYEAKEKKMKQEVLDNELERAKNELFNDDPNAEALFENEIINMINNNKPTDEVKALELIWKNNPNLRASLAETLIDKKYEKIDGKMYFPSSRLDKKYFLSAVKETTREEKLIEGRFDDKFFTTNDSLIELNKIKLELERNGYSVKVGKFSEAKETILNNAITQEDILDLALSAGVDNNNPTLERLVKAIQAKGFSRHFIPKRFIPGFEYNTENFEEAIYRYINAVPFYKNRTIGGSEYGKTIAKLKQKGILKPGSENDLYLQNLKNKIENRDIRLSQALRAISSVYYLALSPSYLSQQIVQPINTLLPLLPIVANELGLGTIEAEKAFGEALFTSLGYWGWKIYDKINRLLGKETKNTFGLDKDFLLNIRSLERQGVGKPLRSMELTGQEVDPEKHYITNLLDVPVKTIRWISTLASLPGIAVEDYTRVIGIRALYNLGIKAGLKGDKLQDFISYSIARSYGPASGRLAKPPGYYIAGEGRTKPVKELAQSVIESWLTFKNFAFMNYGLWGKTWRVLRYNNIFRPLAYKLAGQISLGGLKYIMWSSSVLTLLSIVYAIFDIPEDPEEQYEELFLNLNKLIPGLGDAFYKGVASITFKVDLSSLFAQTSPLEEPFTNDAIELIGGAPSSAIKDISQGKAPRAIRGYQIANEWEEEGIKAGSRKLIPPEEITEEDKTKRKLGYTPLKVSEAYSKESYRKFKSSQYTDIIRKKVSDEIIPLIESGRGAEARQIFAEIYENMKDDNVLTDEQLKSITGVNSFISQVVLTRLGEAERETIKNWKNKGKHKPSKYRTRIERRGRER